MGEKKMGRWEMHESNPPATPSITLTHPIHTFTHQGETEKSALESQRYEEEKKEGKEEVNDAGTLYFSP